MVIVVSVTALLWFLLLIIPWRSWLNGEVLEKEVSGIQAELKGVTVLIPARNECHYIVETLSSVYDQGEGLTVVVVDDGSTDGTADLVRSSFADVQVVVSLKRPEGWSGKLWALHQGLTQIRTTDVLLLDADIVLKPGALQRLCQLKKRDNLHFLSVMARLRNSGLWEKLLIPAFVYFFKQIYPFRLSNSSKTWVAAAAGGCILVDTEVLRQTGGFEKIKGQIIDDCSLARQIKSAGYSTWIGLSQLVQSHRHYDSLQSIWSMVERTAFTQLQHSLFWLLCCSFLMILCFWIPLAGLFASHTLIPAIFALVFMAITFLPTLLFYRQSALWALLLPVTASLYLAMTWSSAVKYWFGTGAEWKGRQYPG